MSDKIVTLEEIRLNGLQALADRLGPVGMVRFLQQFEIGRGNYSEDRHDWIDQSDVQTLVERIKKERKDK